LIARLSALVSIIKLTSRSGLPIWLNAAAITQVREALALNGPGTEITVAVPNAKRDLIQVCAFFGNSFAPHGLSEQEIVMPVSSTSAVERIARVLAGQELSINAEGSDAHAATAIDIEWEDKIDDALAVLRTMREPDADMANVGDVEIWERMIGAAIGQPMEPKGGYEAPPAGTDPLHEGP
jgi:hypothetical protein